MKKFEEKQYSILDETIKNHGLSKLGIMVNESYNNDPKRMLFTFARYKFASKILQNCKTVLEVGCGDAFASRIVNQAVRNLTVLDFDQRFIDDIENRKNKKWNMKILKHDIIKKKIKTKKFDAAYCLDVLEHIPKRLENRFVKNIKFSLYNDGIFLAGMPSLEFQKYASPQSKAGHINCKSGDELNNFMKKHFKNVINFSMSDETVHTGFNKMASYIFSIGFGVKR